MSDSKKKSHKFDGETFQEIIKEAMHKKSMEYAASTLIESFDEDQKDNVLKSVHHIATVADKLKLLLSKLEEQEDQDV